MSECVVDPLVLSAHGIYLEMVMACQSLLWLKLKLQMQHVPEGVAIFQISSNIAL